LGLSSIDLLIINLVAPMLVAYGRWKSDTAMIEKAVDLLMQIKPENNTYTRNWGKIGIFANDAATSQSFIELKSQYCDSKKCLSCAVGIQLLK
jgi:lipid A disaccharide synthetase